MTAASGIGDRVFRPDETQLTHRSGLISQQYAAAATVPLIKSPSLWLPKPVSLRLAFFSFSAYTTQVQLPSDIHPLPEDITAYVSLAIFSARM